MAGQTDPFDIVGKKIDGRYQITEIVCETSFSAVYRATHVIWKRDVAIKAFKVSADVSEEARSSLLDRFIREGALLAELSERCSAICQARDLASLTTESGLWVPYMVLEWVEGEALDLLIDRERREGKTPRTVRDAIALLTPVAQALAVAHERGIVHCDVKPGNILLLRDVKNANVQTKLLDFGVARVLRGARQDVTVEASFTPAYGAPEQWSGRNGEQGPATDVFALALIVVELLAGREVFAGEELAALEIESCDPLRRPTPRALGVSVSDDVERVLSRALALRPAERFGDAHEFWQALCAADSAGQPSADDRRSNADVVIPLLQRRPRQSSRVAAAATVFACAGLGWRVSSQVAGGAWLSAVASSGGPVRSASDGWLATLASTPYPLAPLLATLSVVSGALCIGTLFSVSWLSGKARLMADGPEIGRLCMQLFRRWTAPSLMVSLLAGAGWWVIAAREHPQGRWLYGLVILALAFFALTLVVARRARQLVQGSSDAARGEGGRRLVLLMSVWAAIALAMFQPSLP
jgi:serine/threonine protein kinase